LLTALAFPEGEALRQTLASPRTSPGRGVKERAQRDRAAASPKAASLRPRLGGVTLAAGVAQTTAASVPVRPREPAYPPGQFRRMKSSVVL